MSEDIKDGLDIDFVGNKRWYKGGKLHRIGGPASVWYDGYKHWWLYGTHYLEDEYNKAISNKPLLYWNRFKKGEWL